MTALMLTRRIVRKLAPGMVAMTLFLATVYPAAADNQQDRIAIRKKIDERLQDTASKLKDLDSRSGDAASEIQDAQRNVDEILALLDQLKGVQGDDRDTRDIVDHWPAQAQSLKTAIDALKKLKAGQNYLDGDAKECQQDVSLRKAFLSDRTSADGLQNVNGADEIRTQAAETKKKWLAKKVDAEQFGRTLEGYRGTVAGFSFKDGEWSRVVDSLQNSTGKIFVPYYNLRAQIYDSGVCNSLQLGTSAPEVDQALRTLGEHRGTITTRYNKVKEEFLAFKTEAADFRASPELTAKQIQDAICNDEDWATKVPRISDEKISELRSKWDSLQHHRDQMLNELDQLIRDSKDPTLPKFKRRVVEYLNPLGPIIDNEMRGAANPRIQAYMQVGKDQHKAMQASCDAAEAYLANGTRLDCIKSCTVIEFKPNNTGEVSEGKKQVLEYKEELERMYEKSGQSMFKDKLTSLQKCQDPKEPKADDKPKLVLGTSVETYNFCPNSLDVLLSVQTGLVDWDPPATIDK
jgi:hypothetical protein